MKVEHIMQPWVQWREALPPCGHASCDQHARSPYPQRLLFAQVREVSMSPGHALSNSSGNTFVQQATQRSQRSRCMACRLRPQAGVGDFMKRLMDFEDWAPRSSRTWRLGKGNAPKNAGATVIGIALKSCNPLFYERIAQSIMAMQQTV